ncbi:hypothetical protein [Streptomyces sp. NPDC002580]|uniref:hypothetical protein n=1 Tax=Streptomyces sp. NPDC002580 TaxID=3364653 RepID=UPI00369CAB6B
MDRDKEIKRRTGQLKEPDDYERLGLGYLNSPAPASRWPDEAELAVWKAEAAARPEDVDLREALRAFIDRSAQA